MNVRRIKPEPPPIEFEILLTPAEAGLLVRLLGTMASGSDGGWRVSAPYSQSTREVIDAIYAGLTRS